MSDSSQWEQQVRALREEIQTQRDRLNKLRGVFVDPNAVMYRPLTPLFKLRRQERRRAEREKAAASSAPEPKPVDPEREKRRRQVAYWQRRVREEQRLCVELQERSSPELKRAKQKLREAIRLYGGY